MPPGSAACVASREYQVRNSRSMNHITDQKQVCTISGRATASTSRPPQGRDHQPPDSSGVRCSPSGGEASKPEFWSISTSTLALRPAQKRSLADVGHELNLPGSHAEALFFAARSKMEVEASQYT